MVRRFSVLVLLFAWASALAEGEPILIQSITFDGIKSNNLIRLKEQLRISREGGLYNPETLQIELANLEKYCQDTGFLRARIGPAVVEIQNVPGKGRMAVIRIPVSEGAVYTLGKISVKNAAVLNAATLLQMMPLTEGQPYSRAKINDWREKIADAYRAVGHIRFNSVVKEEMHDLRRIVDCTLELQEENPYQVGKIAIVGDASINPSEVKRLLLFGEGGLYNPEMLSLSLHFINQMGKYRLILPSDIETRIDDSKGIVDFTIRMASLKKTSSLLKPASSPAGFRSSFVPGTLQSQTPQATIRTEVALVNVVFTAVDKNNRFMPGLTASDFTVFEDRQPQKIEYFSDLSQANMIPLTIALLIDTSGSVKNKLSYEKDTAAEFFRDVLRRNKDLALIIQFDSDVNLVQDFTEDPNKLIRSLDSLEAGNSTSLYDAVYLAVNEKLKEETGRKVIVIITDGEDTSSKLRKEAAIEAAQKSDVLIYGVGVRGDFGTNFGVLKKFADETGGMFFSPRASFTEVRAAFQAIGQDLKGQYSLAYSSKNPKRDGSFRSIEIRGKVGGIRIRARKGYYAPKATDSNPR